MAAAVAKAAAPVSEQLRSLLTQLGAACRTTAECAKLAHRLDLDSHDAFRIAAAAQLALQATPPVLETMAVALVLPSSERLVDPARLAGAAYDCSTFVSAVNLPLNMLLAPQRQRAAAAVAASTARPEILLRFLGAAAQALLALTRAVPASGAVLCSMK